MKCYPVKPEDMKINDIIVKDYTPVARIAKTEGEVSNTLRLKDINTDEFFGETVNKSVIMKALQNGTYRLVREEKPSEEQIDKDIKESLKLAGVQLNEELDSNGNEIGYAIVKDGKETFEIGDYIYSNKEEAEEELGEGYSIVKVTFPANTIDESDMEEYLGEDADYPSEEAFIQLSEKTDASAIQDNADGDYVRFYVLQPSQIEIVNESNDEEDKDVYDADHAAEWMERNPHGYYNSEKDYGTDDEERYETCSWCGERYPLSDLRKEKDMGYVCHHCAKGIESREGDLEFED